MWSVCVCLHVCMSVKKERERERETSIYYSVNTVQSVRRCQPNTSDQHVYTQASLCCHTGINRVWGCVNHSKPQKTPSHTRTHTHTHVRACQAAIPCSCAWRAKQSEGANRWTAETEQWTIKKTDISWKKGDKTSLRVIFSISNAWTTQLYQLSAALVS